MSELLKVSYLVLFFIFATSCKKEESYSENRNSSNYDYITNEAAVFRYLGLKERKSFLNEIAGTYRNYVPLKNVEVDIISFSKDGSFFMYKNDQLSEYDYNSEKYYDVYCNYKIIGKVKEIAKKTKLLKPEEEAYELAYATHEIDYVVDKVELISFNPSTSFNACKDWANFIEEDKNYASNVLIEIISNKEIKLHERSPRYYNDENYIKD